MNVLVLVGSLRAASTNNLLARAAVRHLPAGTDVTFFEGLDALPFYSEELDAETPPADVARLRQAVTDADALLLATPEYNGTVSAVLKNAIDWASRPRGAAAIAGKPAVVLAASGAGRNGAWAREDTIKALRVAGADVSEDSFGIAQSWKAFDADGTLVDADLDAELASLMHRMVRIPAAA